jgi:chlorite dismutase
LQEESHGEGKQLKAPDLLEHGAHVGGSPQALDTRLYVQLQVFTGCLDPAEAVEAVKGGGLDAAVYLHVNDPRGIGVLVMAEDPVVFTGNARRMLTDAPFDRLTPLPDFTMMGRTYATGRESDLEDWLLRKAKRNALNPRYPWAVWYPLRRVGGFSRLSREEQGEMMIEHAMIGRAYGEAGHAFDIRLECHGLDRDDNEFVLGLVSSQLHTLSKLVKEMRRTRQTSEFMGKMGPFFVGRAIWQSPMPERRTVRSSPTDRSAAPR